jgi:hypothetical protein
MIPDELLLLQNGNQVGPFPKSAIQGMLESGSVLPSDIAWGQGMADWATLESLFPGVGPSVAPSHPLGQSVPTTVPLPAQQDRGFGSLVADAFSYPFRGDGVIILVVGTIAFTIVNFLSLFSLWLTIAGWGYLMLMLQQVIHGTALGEDTVPKWPDFDGFGELAVKFIQWLLAVVICFAGAVILLAKSHGSEDGSWMVYGLLAALAGGLYFPMAILGIAMFDSVAALNPMLVVRSILRVPGHYILTLIVFVGLGLVKHLTGKLGDLPGAIGYVGIVVDEFDALWSAIFLARVLGGLYYVNRRKLGWF